MNYEKKYDEALERAKKLRETCDSQAVVGWCEYLFPELKESEDERIRKKLLNLLKELLELGGVAQDTWSMNDCEQFIAWLEKQEPKQKWVDRACKWLFDNFRISSFDSQKIVTDFTNMYDLRDSFIKATEE